MCDIRVCGSQITDAVPNREHRRYFPDAVLLTDAVEKVIQRHVDRKTADLIHRNADRRKRHLRKLGLPVAVRPDDGKILRHMEAALIQKMTETDCATSSSRAPITGAVAAIADPPQIEEPTPTRIDVFG